MSKCDKHVLRQSKNVVKKKDLESSSGVADYYGNCTIGQPLTDFYSSTRRLGGTGGTG